MAWVAEILRKNHRECAVCRMAPTHLYAPDEADISALEVSPEPSGTPLCHTCLGLRLGQDLSRFTGRCLIFEPAMGPETYVFQETRGEAHATLSRLPAPCRLCGAQGRFFWVPVAHDAGLWGDEWLPALEARELSAADPLCGPCAGARLAASLEERGLVFEAITPARGAGDGILSGREASLAPDAEE